MTVFNVQLLLTNMSKGKLPASAYNVILDRDGFPTHTVEDLSDVSESKARLTAGEMARGVLLLASLTEEGMSIFMSTCSTYRYSSKEIRSKSAPYAPTASEWQPEVSSASLHRMLTFMTWLLQQNPALMDVSRTTDVHVQ